MIGMNCAFEMITKQFEERNNVSESSEKEATAISPTSKKNIYDVQWLWVGQQGTALQTHKRER